MTKFASQRLVHHSVSDMFALVAGVESYPEFVPLCSSLNIKERSTAYGRRILVVDMTVAFKFVCETFTSRVELNEEEHQILVEYLDGPFRHLENRWSFVEQGETACVVDFFLEYEFRSRPLQLLMGGMFNKAFGKFAEAFEKRADDIYGVNNLGPRTAEA